jgi:hypothetical protein
MQVTIDSGDSLDQALGALAALYGVRLTTVEDKQSAGAQPEAASARPRKRSTRRSDTSGRTRRPSKRPPSPAKPDQATVRTWARERGLQVSDRGRVSNEILEAYRQGTSGT